MQTPAPPAAQTSDETPPQVAWARPTGFALLALVVIVPVLAFRFAGGTPAALIAISLCMIPLIFGLAMATGGWPRSRDYTDPPLPRTPAEYAEATRRDAGRDA